MKRKSIKKCSSCGLKERTSYNTRCRDCLNKYMWRDGVRERKRLEDREYQSRKRKELVGYKTEEYREYREKYPEKVLAQQKLNKAIKQGKIKRSPCEVCGRTDVHGHHDNYLMPYSVRWLCPVHHKEVHQV